MVQRELAHHCGSTALASVDAPARHRASPRGATAASLPGAEATLRRVADEGIVLVSTGGADFTHPRGEADQGRRRLPGQRAARSSPASRRPAP